MKTFRKYLTALAFAATALTSGWAQAAALLDAWQFNLGALNGQLVDGNAIVGATDRINIDHIVVSGISTIEQTVVGGSALGQPFVDSGYLQFLASSPEGGGAQSFLNFGTAGGNQVFGFVEFTGLTGVLNNDGTITFDAGSGSIAFWLTTQTTLDSTLGSALKLFDLVLIDPSGGSNLDFFGGAGANASIDVTALITNELIPGLIADSAGDPVSLLSLHLVNVDALLDPNFNPNPDNTGIDPETGNGVSIIRVQNAGQYNVAVVPEPGTVALMGIGLLGLGLVRRRRVQR